jgi:hypothetical protein
MIEKLKLPVGVLTKLILLVGMSGIDPLGTARKLPVRKNKSDSYYDSTVILLGLISCNPTSTPTL